MYMDKGISLIGSRVGNIFLPAVNDHRSIGVFFIRRLLTAVYKSCFFSRHSLNFQNTSVISVSPC